MFIFWMIIQGALIIISRMRYGFHLDIILSVIIIRTCMYLIFVCDFICCIKLEDSHHTLVRKLGGRWSSHLDYLPPWVCCSNGMHSIKFFHFLKRVKWLYFIIIRYVDCNMKFLAIKDYDEIYTNVYKFIKA